MNFSKGLDLAYKTNWSYINTFTVQLGISSDMRKAAGWNGEEGDEINLFVKSFTTPEFTNQPIEAFIGDRWRIHNGRPEMWRFTISFRDKDLLSLYRKFIKSYNFQKEQYFDICKMNVILSKDADYTHEKDTPLFNLENVLIESVSSMQFSNETDSQIAEFDVQFKCAKPTII